VLVAEDNPINQKLVVRMLEKLGHRVALAEHGAAALRMLDEQPFDLVLMDVQMPELDGLEATRRIRQREVSTGQHVPIIALTAHAMTGDRERCLAAGMDGYLAKPVQLAELGAALDSLATGPGPLLDRGALLERTGGEPALLKEAVELFLLDSTRILGELQDALQLGDARRVARLAHTLRGDASPFGAVAACRRAQDLEQQGQAGELTQAAATCAHLAHDVQQLQAGLRALLLEQPPVSSLP